MGKAVSVLKSVRGIRAIMLGGSWASGNHRADSDIDIGIYYADSATLGLSALNGEAEQLDDTRGKDLIAPPGAWLTVDGMPVDFIFSVRTILVPSGWTERGWCGACLRQKNWRSYTYPSHFQ